MTKGEQTGLREALPSRDDVALLMLRFEADGAECPPDTQWLETSGRWILAQLGKEHYGDCTKAPITCNVCVAEDAYKMADAVLDLFARSGRLP